MGKSVVDLRYGQPAQIGITGKGIAGAQVRVGTLGIRSLEPSRRAAYAGGGGVESETLSLARSSVRQATPCRMIRWQLAEEQGEVERHVDRKGERANNQGEN